MKKLLLTFLLIFSTNSFADDLFYESQSAQRDLEQFEQEANQKEMLSKLDEIVQIEKNNQLNNY